MSIVFCIMSIILVLCFMKTTYCQQNYIELNRSLIDPFHKHETINFSNPDLKYNLVESYQHDLDGDEKIDTICLYHIEQLRNDPGDFHRLQVILANGDSFDIINVDGWIKDNHYKPKENELASDYITITEYEEAVFLLCFGWPYASQPALLTILDFSSGKSRVIFNKEFALRELSPSDNVLLTGVKHLKQPFSNIEPKEYELKIVDNTFELQ
jgi:hypothetical protein